MSKTLTRIWLNHLTFDEAVKSGDGKYLTIISTTSRELEPMNVNGIFLKVGELNDYCDEYKVIENESGTNWKDFVELKYEQDHLHITPKGEKFSMNMPIVFK